MHGERCKERDSEREREREGKGEGGRGVNILRWERGGEECEVCMHSERKIEIEVEIDG